MGCVLHRLKHISVWIVLSIQKPAHMASDYHLDGADLTDRVAKVLNTEL